MTEELKKQIDEMPYIEMFRLRRFAPAGSPYFCGETGEYFLSVMAEKRKQITDAQYTKISKEIGWD